MDELAFLTALHRPGLIVDVGAHDGLLTLPLSHLPGARVLAFEPLPQAHARLARACAGLANVTLRPEALSDAPGTLTLDLPVLDGVPQEQWASTVKSYDGYGSRVGTQRVSVPAITLDSLALEAVVALKVDAEGAEYEVLRGARETLRRCRPVLSLELEERHREGATWAVPAFLDALDYGTFFPLDGAWHSIASLDRARCHRASADPSVFGAASERYVFNFYAWPRERDAEIRAAVPPA